MHRRDKKENFSSWFNKFVLPVSFEGKRAFEFLDDFMLQNGIQIFSKSYFADDDVISSGVIIYRVVIEMTADNPLHDKSISNYYRLELPFIDENYKCFQI